MVFAPEGLRQFVADNARFVTAVGFSCIFSCILSFLLEGQLLYFHLRERDAASTLITVYGLIWVYCAGLFTCGLFVKYAQPARRVVLWGGCLCIALTLILFVIPCVQVLPIAFVTAYVSGCVIAACGGFYFKIFIPRDERFNACAEVLMLSYGLVCIVVVLDDIFSLYVGHFFILIINMAGVYLLMLLPFTTQAPQQEKALPLQSTPPLYSLKTFANMIRQYAFLYPVLFFLAGYYGLMLQVIYPVFGEPNYLVTWHWAIPYLVVLFILRILPVRMNRVPFLNIGVCMILLAFICFMYLDRNAIAYVAVCSFMTGALGICKVSLWSVLSELTDYTEDSATIFGTGLAAGIAGLLCGSWFGVFLTSHSVADAEVTVIVLAVACGILILLPHVDKRLILLMGGERDDHKYFSQKQEDTPLYEAFTHELPTAELRTSELLTVREQEILQLVLQGKTNKIISDTLYISENTVRTHIRRILAKHDADNRVTLLKKYLHREHVDFTPPPRDDKGMICDFIKFHPHG